MRTRLLCCTEIPTGHKAIVTESTQYPMGTWTVNGAMMEQCWGLRVIKSGSLADRNTRTHCQLNASALMGAHLAS